MLNKKFKYINLLTNFEGIRDFCDFFESFVKILNKFLEN